MIAPLLRSKPFRFLAVGGLMTLSGLALNGLLIEIFHLSHPVSYGIVMLFLIVLGFVLNRLFVFENQGAPLPTVFLQYLSAIILFRLADWGLYNVQVHWLSVSYPLAQIINNAVIVLFKYFLYQGIFESNRKAGKA